MRRKYLPFALPDLGEEELAHVTESIQTGWLTTGPKVKQFEKDFAEAVGATHAIAVNSCTAAMHLALEAIGLQMGDEVITTPYTFAATAEVIRYFNAKPVLVDVDPVTLNLDPAYISSAITKKTKAIIPVHIAGLSADLTSMNQIAKAHGLAVIEDAAHAFPTTHQGQIIGAHSDFTCFSFYATKTLTTGEGGMICTENEAYADRCRVMALHGISKDAWKRYTAEGSWYYEIIAPGYKYNMSDLAAGLGLGQLRRAVEMGERRAEIAAHYQKAFGEIEELQIPPAQAPYGAPTDQHAWHLYLLRLHLDQLSIDRAEFVAQMKQRNIGTSVHFIPLHIHPYYRDMYGYQPMDYPVAYQEYLREISLPIFSKMSDTDVQDVIDAVQDIVHTYKKKKNLAVGTYINNDAS